MTTAAVRLWGRQIGAVSTEEDRDYCAFQYTPEFAESGVQEFNEAEKTLLTTMPFVSRNEINYEKLVTWAGDDYKKYAWLIFIPIVIFIITAVSNGANLSTHNG